MAPHSNPRRYSPLRRFYRRLRLQTEVDPIALLALLLSLIPLLIGSVNFFTPEKLEINTPDKAVFFVNTISFPDSDNPSQLEYHEIIKVSIPFQITNNHPSKESYIEKIIVQLKVGNEESNQHWEEFVNSSFGPTGELIWNEKEDASKTKVTSRDVFSEEIRFTPDAAPPSDPLNNSIVKSNFIDKVRSGEKIELTIIVRSKISEKKINLTPRSSNRVVDFITSKGFMTTELKLETICQKKIKEEKFECQQF